MVAGPALDRRAVSTRLRPFLQRLADHLPAFNPHLPHPEPTAEVVVKYHPRICPRICSP
jgi:hypothetical protein